MAAPADTDAITLAPRRLRDLRGRDRRVVLVMFALLLLPFAVALVRSYHDHWMPSGDEANIATRALDVFSRHPPLTGLPSTSYLYGDQIQTNHPGPMEFYLLAIPLRVLGSTAGPLLTAAAINAACVLIAAWVFFRRLGVQAMLWAGTLLLVVMFSGGTAVLVDTLSSNMTLYSLLATAVLVWAVIDGDRRLLPLTAFVASYAAQQHLANALLVFVLLVVMVVTLAVQIVADRRTSAAPRGALRPWMLGGLGLVAVCWSPVLIQQFTGHPGNLTEIIRFARDSKRPTLGFAAGWHQAVHAISPAGVLTRTDTTGDFFYASPGALRTILAILVFAALGAIVVWCARRSRTLARLAGVALVVIVAGTVNGSNVPQSFEQSRVNLYRWTWTAGFLAWAAIGIAAGPLLRRLVARISAETAPRLAVPALLAAAALVAGSVIFVHGADDHNREVKQFAMERRIDKEVLAHIDHHRPVLVYQLGTDATLSLAPQLIFRLVQAGVHVEVSKSSADTIYGKQRRYQYSRNIQEIAITSGLARGPSGPGALLLWQPFGPPNTVEFQELSARRSELLDALTREVRGKKVVLAPGAIQRIDRKYPALQALTLTRVLTNLGRDPLTTLATPEIQVLLREGVLQQPVVDQSKLRALTQLHPYSHTGAFGDEQVEVHWLDAYWTAYCTQRPCFSPE